MREAVSGQRDLEAIQRTMISPGLMAAFDLPFAPLFFAGIFVFHAWMGYLGLAAAAILILLALANQWASQKPLETANNAQLQAELMGNHLRSEAEMIQSMGMRGAAFGRWMTARARSLDATVDATDTGGGYSAMINAFRMFVQSAMLGLGAYLVLEGMMSAGAMIAGSILLGRALAPIEQIVGQWPFSSAGARAGATCRSSWAKCPRNRAAPPCPAQGAAGGRTDHRHSAGRAGGDAADAVLRGEPRAGGGGDRHLGRRQVDAGARADRRLAAAAGKIRLDGAALDQYDPDVLGQYIGYLPQRVALFEGTIKENIARMSLAPDDAAVVRPPSARRRMT